MKGYNIGKPPISDPCKECILKVNCRERCKDKILWIANNPKKETSRIKLRRKKKRENKK